MARYDGYGRMREEGLPDIGASAAVPAGYGAPTFGTGDAAPGGLNPDQTLLADSVPDGAIDPNTGFSIGGADDPLAEGFDDGVALGEDGLPMDDIPVDDGYPVMEDGEFDPIDSNEMQFEGLEDLPPFEEDDDNPDLDGLAIDEDGIIEPMVIPSEIEEDDPALGTMPEAELPMEEPIVQVESDDVEIQIPEDALDSDMPDPIEVVESFVLPENKEVVVTKGDKIFVIGKIHEGYRPRYAPSVFERALKSLCESTGEKHPTFSTFDGRRDKVAIVGRSTLIEAAHDWRIPGTDRVVEKHDLIQIVSAYPFSESVHSYSPAARGVDREKLKSEEIMAYRRWRDAKARRTEAEKQDAKASGKKEGDSKEQDSDSGNSDGKKGDGEKDENKAKKESAYL